MMMKKIVMAVAVCVACAVARGERDQLAVGSWQLAVGSGQLAVGSWQWLAAANDSWQRQGF
jgi:sulfur relay (sulfurtransferase) complex TusBCD TusD component (DsrE family)